MRTATGAGFGAGRRMSRAPKSTPQWRDDARRWRRWRRAPADDGRLGRRAERAPDGDRPIDRPAIDRSRSFTEFYRVFFFFYHDTPSLSTLWKRRARGWPRRVGVEGYRRGGLRPGVLGNTSAVSVATDAIHRRRQNFLLLLLLLLLFLLLLHLLLFPLLFLLLLTRRKRTRVRPLSDTRHRELPPLRPQTTLFMFTRRKLFELFFLFRTLTGDPFGGISAAATGSRLCPEGHRFRNAEFVAVVRIPPTVDARRRCCVIGPSGQGRGGGQLMSFQRIWLANRSTNPVAMERA